VCGCGLGVSTEECGTALLASLADDDTAADTSTPAKLVLALPLTALLLSAVELEPIHPSAPVGAPLTIQAPAEAEETKGQLASATAVASAVDEEEAEVSPTLREARTRMMRDGPSVAGVVSVDGDAAPLMQSTDLAPSAQVAAGERAEPAAVEEEAWSFKGSDSSEEKAMEALVAAQIEEVAYDCVSSEGSEVPHLATTSAAVEQEVKGRSPGTGSAAEKPASTVGAKMPVASTRSASDSTESKTTIAAANGAPHPTAAAEAASQSAVHVSQAAGGEQPAALLVEAEAVAVTHQPPTSAAVVTARAEAVVDADSRVPTARVTPLKPAEEHAQQPPMSPEAKRMKAWLSSAKPNKSTVQGQPTSVLTGQAAAAAPAATEAAEPSTSPESKPMGDWLQRAKDKAAAKLPPPPSSTAAVTAVSHGGLRQALPLGLSAKDVHPAMAMPSQSGEWRHLLSPMRGKAAMTTSTPATPQGVANQSARDGSDLDPMSLLDVAVAAARLPLIATPPPKISESPIVPSGMHCADPNALPHEQLSIGELAQHPIANPNAAGQVIKPTAQVQRGLQFVSTDDASSHAMRRSPGQLDSSHEAEWQAALERHRGKHGWLLAQWTKATRAVDRLEAEMTGGRGRELGEDTTRRPALQQLLDSPASSVCGEGTCGPRLRDSLDSLAYDDLDGTTTTSTAASYTSEDWPPHSTQKTTLYTHTAAPAVEDETPVRLLTQAKTRPAATFVNGSKRPAGKPTLNLAAVSRRAQRSVLQASRRRRPPPAATAGVLATSPRKLRLLHNPLVDAHAELPPRPPRRAPAEEDWGANDDHAAVTASAHATQLPSATARPVGAAAAMPAAVPVEERTARAGARELAAPSPRSQEAAGSPNITMAAAAVSPSVRLLRRREWGDESPLVASPKATSSDERGSMDDELWEPFPQPKGSASMTPAAVAKAVEAAPLAAVLTPASDSGSLPLGEKTPTRSPSAAGSQVSSSGSSQERGLRLLRRSPSEQGGGDENADPNAVLAAGATDSNNATLKVEELLREMQAVRRLLEQSPAGGAGVAGVADGALQAALSEALKTVVGGYLPGPDEEERDEPEAAGGSVRSSPQSSVADEQTAVDAVGETTQVVDREEAGTAREPRVSGMMRRLSQRKAAAEGKTQSTPSPESPLLEALNFRQHRDALGRAQVTVKAREEAAKLRARQLAQQEVDLTNRERALQVLQVRRCFNSLSGRKGSMSMWIRLTPTGPHGVTCQLSSAWS
jgi:hypothetical protein